MPAACDAGAARAPRTARLHPPALRRRPALVIPTVEPRHRRAPASHRRTSAADAAGGPEVRASRRATGGKKPVEAEGGPGEGSPRLASRSLVAPRARRRWRRRVPHAARHPLAALPSPHPARRSPLSVWLPPPPLAPPAVGRAAARRVRTPIETNAKREWHTNANANAARRAEGTKAAEARENARRGGGGAGAGALAQPQIARPAGGRAGEPGSRRAWGGVGWDEVGVGGRRGLLPGWQRTRRARRARRLGAGARRQERARAAVRTGAAAAGGVRARSAGRGRGGGGAAAL